jgi:hypothetical protein
LQKNLGLSVKLFDEMTQVIKEEMDKYISIVILAYLHEVMYSQDYLKFIEAVNNAHKYCFIYLNNGYTNLNWETMTNDVYQEYINYFDTNETKNLKEKVKKVNWVEIDNIELKYQQIFEVLYTSRNIESLTPDQIDITKIYKTDERNKTNSFILITSDSNDENENENENENNENEIKTEHKISELSLLYINYTYQILKIFVTTTNDDRKDEIVDKLFKTTRDILMDTNNLLTNNQNSNNQNKKIALYYSDLIVMEDSLCAILDLYENEDLQKLFSDIRQSCVDNIIHSITVLNNLILNNFNSLDFDNYPILKDDYNNYVKDFMKIKDIYNEIISCIDKNDIDKIFNTSFDFLFEELNKSISKKGNIKNEGGVAQFKKEFTHINDIFKSFSLLNVEKYLKIVDKILNPGDHSKDENKNESETETKDE